MKIIYTNIGGIILTKLMLIDFLREKEPEIVCRAKTKLTDDIQIKIKKKW